ncbi:hypothetical protein [Wolbachia endosymbiont of Aedes albopictus]|uniref:hypothetical protein n=1 Tax=Wolbachia endosymbiont of Aedes albopictus TaxID=167957 RepID=UPI001F0166F2|nr:hypothetical protein [Wolbachia endosymbiont of Aedes albopictus]
MNKTKSFDIPKQLIWRAYKQVSKNRGAAGVDGVSITKFEENLKDIYTNYGIVCHPEVIFQSL